MRSPTLIGKPGLLKESAMLFDVIDCISDRLDLLVIIVRNRDSKLVFELHHELNHIQRISLQVSDER